VSRRRRRNLVAILLRGGRIGRRIRVKAILLSSSRGDLQKFNYWTKVEGAKGFIPVGFALLAKYLGMPVPMILITVLLAAAAAWLVFVMFHAFGTAFRVNQRHAAYMKAVGVDTDLFSSSGEGRPSGTSAGRLTMRDFIAARRTIPARI
jgi:hypothetical protein